MTPTERLEARMSRRCWRRLRRHRWAEETFRSPDHIRRRCLNCDTTRIVQHLIHCAHVQAWGNR